MVRCDLGQNLTFFNVYTPNSRAANAQEASALVLDIAAIIHMIRPTTAKIVNEYVIIHIVLFLESQIKNNTQRINAVWDNYPEENNLKPQQRRGNGPHTRVGNGNRLLLYQRCIGIMDFYKMPTTKLNFSL